jgi:hypothetical protein
VDSEVWNVLAASDCLVSCSTIGESFGLAIAEAMAMGLPVIVNSTPKADNAQVELCEHMVTGIVANTVGSIAAALELLHDCPEFPRTLGANGRQLVERMFSAAVVERRIRRFIRERLAASMNPLSERIPATAEAPSIEIDSASIARFQCRERTAFRPATGIFRSLADRLHLSVLAGADALAYAKKVGAREVTSIIRERLHRRSVLRA